MTQIGGEINKNQKAIGEKKKAKEDATEFLQKKADLEKEKADLEKAAVDKEAALWKIAKTVGNYVDDTVPVSNNEDNNKIERTWGDEKTKTKVKLSHHEVMLRLAAYDPVRGVKLIGHRGYCLTGYGVFLYVLLSQSRITFVGHLLTTGLGIKHSSIMVSSFSSTRVRNLSQGLGQSLTIERIHAKSTSFLP